MLERTQPLGPSNLGQLRRLIAAPLVIVFACLSLTFSPAAMADDKSKNDRVASWIGTWAVALMLPGLFDAPVTPPNDQTLRQVVRISAGGRDVRIRVSNVLGTAPLLIGAASVAKWDGDARIRPGSSRSVTFGGESQILIPAGARVLSDPVGMRVRNLSDLAISLYIPEGATAPDSGVTGHVRALQTAHVLSGNQVDVVDPLVDQTNTSYTYLTGVDVKVRPNLAVVATAGDSITDGDESTFKANNRWPKPSGRTFYPGTR